MSLRPAVLRVWCRWSLIYPTLAALLLLGAASLFPLRLDQRNFQDQARVAGMELPRGTPYLFVSQGADAVAYHFAGYVLHNLGYPAQDRRWLVLNSSELEQTSWALTLDDQGQISSPAHATVRRPATEIIGRYVDSGVVLFDTQAVRMEAERRLPLLRVARHGYVVPPFVPATLPWRGPRSMFTVMRIAHTTALLGLALTLYPLILLRLPAGWRSPGLAGALMTPIAIAVVVWSCSWSQVVPVMAPGPWLVLAWICTGAGLWQTLHKQAAPETSIWVPISVAHVGVCAVVLAVFLLRGDFDEDTHTHWMIMARSYYALGLHDPQRLVSHIHAATYPFGWAEVMSTCAWAADLPRDAFLGLNEGTALALLIYRTVLAALALSAVGSAAALLSLAAPASRLWLVAWALFPALFPIIAGQHVGAESLLLPLLATAITTLWAGRRAGSPGLLALGLWLGAAATLVKLEAGFLFAVVVLPWMLGPGLALALRGSGALRVALTLVTGLAPTLIWRLTLPIDNTVYAWPTLDSLRAVVGFAAPTYMRCLLVIVKGTGVLLFGAALPVAVLFRLRAGGLRDRSFLFDLVVPLSIVAAGFGLASFYLFSTLPRAWQIDVSYGRLLLLPSWSAVLYCFESLLPVQAERG